jgi:hypothetical protein
LTGAAASRFSFASTVNNCQSHENKVVKR